MTPHRSDTTRRETLGEVWRDRRFVVQLGLVTLAGLVLRLWYFFEFKRADGHLVDEGDAFYYAFQAVSNAEGHFFVHPFEGVPAADHPPMTSLLLTPVSMVFGSRIAPMRLAMVVLGTFVVGIVGLLGRAVGRRMGWSDRRCRLVGVLAASAAAVNASLWMNDVLLMSETPGALVMALLLLAAHQQWGETSMRGALTIGILLGVGVLTRAEFGMYAVLLALPLFLTDSTTSWSVRVKRLTACALVSIVIVGPWVAWNQTRFDDPVLISTNDGLTLAGANCDSSYYGGATGFWVLDCAIDDVPEGDQSVRSSVWRDEGLSYAADHLDRLPVVALSRLGRAWGVHEPRQTVFFNAGEGREGFASWIGLWQLWLMLPLGVTGAVVLRRHQVTLVPTLGVVAQVSLTSVLFYGIVRFRIAADVLLCALVAVAIAAAIERVRLWAVAAEVPDDKRNDEEIDDGTADDGTADDATPTDATPTDATPTNATPTDATPTDEPGDEPFRLGRRPALDGIRGLAVLAVVAFHLDWGIASAGFLGVDLFFVLSGFLITALLLEERARLDAISLPKFWARRALRLLPAMFSVVAFVVVYAAIWEDGGFFRRTLSDGVATIFYVANWKLVADNGVIPELLDHAWSLAIEEQFYLIWPVVVAGLVGASARVSARTVGAFAAVGASTSLAIRLALSLTSTEDLAYYATIARADGLLLGAAIAGLLRAAPSVLRRVPASTAVVGTVAFGILVVFGSRGRLFDVFGIAAAGIAASAILLGVVAHERGTLHRLFVSGPATAIGRRSYGLYLWHWPIFLILRPSRVTDLAWWQLDALRVALAFAVTWLSYRFIEQPFLARKARFAPTPTPTTATTAAADARTPTP